MGTLIRYLFVFVLFVVAAYAAVTVEIEGQTLFSRLKTHDYRGTWASWTERATPEKPPPPMDTVQDEPAAKKRVAALEKATRRLSSAKRPQKARQTHVEKRASPAQKKALDDLVSSRLNRAR